jgi:hypothetical protein
MESNRDLLMDEVCRTLAEIAEEGSIRGAARSSDHDKLSHILFRRSIAAPLYS